LVDRNKKTSGRMVRVEDVAREAGVSPITVSRTLSNPEKVREETRKKVEAAVAKTGYVLNRFASSLRSGRSTIISMFVSNLANPHFANAIQGCVDAFEGSRYHLLLAQTGYADVAQPDMLEEVLPFRPAAMIFAGPVESESVRAQLRAMDMPVMELWDYMPDPVDMLVGFSGAEGGRLLGQHFRERGYRKVAYVGRTTGRSRGSLDGFTEALGRNVDFVLALEGRLTIGDGMTALETIIAQLPDVDAIQFAGDVLAVGALLQARKMGIDVPGRVAIAGYGDLEFSPHVTPSLTTIHVSSYQMGLAAGQMLLRRLNKEEIGERVVKTPIHIELRDSTA
jgi:LacI family gluconate utilization system Gnt-I transcriptional repressor